MDVQSSPLLSFGEDFFVFRFHDLYQKGTLQITKFIINIHFDYICSNNKHKLRKVVR